MSNAAYSSLKAAYHLDRMQELRDGDQPAPVHLHFIISDLCNHDCFAEGTLVDCQHETRPIENISPGDVIRTPDGRLVSVTEVGIRQVDEVYEITSGGETVRVTGNHPFLTQDGWKTAKSLRPGRDSTVMRLRMRKVPEMEPTSEEVGQVYFRSLSHPEGKRLRSSHSLSSKGGAISRRSEVPMRMWKLSESARLQSRKDGNLALKGRVEVHELAQSAPCPSKIYGRRTIVGQSQKPGLWGQLPEEVHRVDSSRDIQWWISREKDGDRIRLSSDSTLPPVQVALPRYLYRRSSQNDPRLLASDIAGLLLKEACLERGLELRQVDSVQRVTERVTVYNLSCPPIEAYTANGFAVANCSFCAYRMSGEHGEPKGFSTEQFGEDTGKGFTMNPNRQIPFKKCIEILEDAAALGVKAVQFTGGGEPTVHPQHLKIFALAQRFGLETSLVTNGYLLREGWEEVYQKMAWIRVSIDAGSADVYAKVRRIKPEGFERVLNNVHKINERIRSTRSDCLLGVGYVVTRDNWQDLLKGVELIKRTGVPYVRLAAMFSDQGSKYYDAPADGHRSLYSAIRTAIDAARESYEDENFKIVDLFGQRVGDLDQGSPDYKMCGYQYTTMYIAGNQKVYRCCTTAYTMHGEVGDLSKTSFLDWFKSSNKFSMYDNFDARTCRVCQFNDKNRVINYIVDGNPLHVNFV